MPRGYRNTAADFWALVDVRGPDDCWHFNRKRNITGYPRWSMGETLHAHVWAYILAIGPVPRDSDGRRLHVDHLCHVAGECLLVKDCPHRDCCNPAHLEAKPSAQNVMRGNSPLANHARKTCCPKCGSEYVNRPRPGRPVHRVCLPCLRAWRRARATRG